MLCTALALFTHACASSTGGQQIGSERAGRSEEPPKPELLGLVTREEVETAVPDWVEQEIESSPDFGVAAELVAALEEAEVTVFLGTWCSDSRRELARLWRAFDEVAVESPATLTYIGVDRSKEEPRELVEGSGLLYVPTFVVRLDGEEVGRIVEQAPAGIEFDLLSLVRGDTSGLVTAKEELLDESAAGER